MGDEHCIHRWLIIVVSMAAFVHPIIAILVICKCVTDFRYDVYRRNTFVVREVIALWHSLMREDVKFLRIRIGCLEKHVHTMCQVDGRGESNPNRRPTIFVLDDVVVLLKNIIDVNLWSTFST